MTALALALVCVAALAFRAWQLELEDRRAVRAEKRVQVVELEDFLSLQRSVLELKASLEKVQAKVAFQR